MKNLFKAAFLSSVITAAMVYVLLEWRPLRSELSRPPEVSWASSPASALAPVPAAPVTDDERNNIEIYQKYSQGVVNITSTTLAYDFFLRPIPQSGTGSGAIIDTQGHIVTNYHVIRDAELLEVTLPNKSKHKAKVVGTDPNNDLAVIQIDVPRGTTLTPIPLGTSKGLQVGQKVLAIGNPFGLDRTMTTGIISALGRSIQAENGRIIDDIIQTDAAINHGNSGGPLLNNQGQIIGINAAILSPNDTGNYGIGFAIPADTVRRITDEILKLGYVRHAYLGVDYRSLIPLADIRGLAEALDLNTDGGLLVVSVPQNGPLAQAGIREANRRVRVGNYLLPAGGDVILAVNGKNVNSFNELASEIDRYRPGDRVAITILRGNRKMDLQVTLQELPRQQ
jgi:S1-C subfamily serine protease